MTTRLFLHSPARAVTLEILSFDKETNQVEVLSLETGQHYRMPYEPAEWKAKGWVRDKVEQPGMEDEEDRRTFAWQAGAA